MAPVRMNITLTEREDAWVAAQIEAGRFANESECIRALICREQDRLHMETVRSALIEGERSGEPRPFDFDEYIDSQGRPA